MSSKDFRARQIQTSQIISSGSTSTGAKIIFYDISAQDTVSPKQGIIDPSLFSTSSIGTDIFFYVSGGIGNKDIGDSNSIAVFGGDVHVSGNFSIDGVGGGAAGTTAFRIGFNDFSSTTNTSSNPLIVGQVIFPGDEFSGSLTLRTVLSVEPGGTGSVRLFNMSSGSYVELKSGETILSASSQSPTILLSQDLYGAINFNTSSQAIYELHIHTSNEVSTVFVGGTELRPSGSFTGVTNTFITSSTSTFYSSGTWVDENSKLKTTSSVAIDSSDGFASSNGEDIYFYVSGGIGERNINSGSISVFGGDVHVSGNLSIEGQGDVGSGIFHLTVVDYATTTATSSNPQAVGQVIFDGTQFSGSLTLQAIVNSTVSGGIATVKLFELTTGSFVDIGGVGNQELSVTGTNPECIESVDLYTANGFLTNSVGKYELSLYSRADSELVSIGGGVLKPLGSFTGRTVYVTGSGESTASIIRFTITDYATTVNTSSLPEVVGQFAFNTSDYSGSFVVFESILTALSSTVTASVKLLNLDDQAFVEIGGPGIDYISSVGFTSINVSSINLTEAANFNAASSSNYELQLYTSDNTIPVTIGGAVFAVTGAFIATPSWTDTNGIVATTSSVEISGNLAVGGQAYPLSMGSLTLTGTSLLTNFDDSFSHFHLMTADASLSTASNQQPGASYNWIIRQDVNGLHTLTFDTNYFTIIGNTTTIISGADKTTILSGISDGVTIFLAIAGDES